MLTISEAAKALGLSEGRTRALVASGKLDAEKRGRQWMVYERSVMERACKEARAGRPRKAEAGGDPACDPVLDQAYSLYLDCREFASQGDLSALIQGAQTAEERDFYICLFNFFLGKRCEGLDESDGFQGEERTVPSSPWNARNTRMIRAIAVIKQ